MATKEVVNNGEDYFDCAALHARLKVRACLTNMALAKKTGDSFLTMKTPPACRGCLGYTSLNVELIPQEVYEAEVMGKMTVLKEDSLKHLDPQDRRRVLGARVR